MLLLDCFGRLFSVAFRGEEGLLGLEMENVSGIQRETVCAEEHTFASLENETVLLGVLLGETAEQRGKAPLVSYMLSKRFRFEQLERISLERAEQVACVVEDYSNYIQILHERGTYAIKQFLAAQNKLALHIHLNAIIHWVKRQDSSDLTNTLAKQGVQVEELLQICKNNLFPDLYCMLLYLQNEPNFSEAIDFCFSCFAPDLVHTLLENCSIYKYQLNLIYPLIILIGY